MYIRRKVYSLIEEENNQKQNLYSVMMNDAELALFSEFEEGFYESLYSDAD